MSGPVLTVGQGVIAELVKTAAFEVPGVARVGYGGPSWRGWLAGPAVRVRVVNDRVLVRLRIVARPGHTLGPRERVVARAIELLPRQPRRVVVLDNAAGASKPNRRGVGAVSSHPTAITSMTARASAGVASGGSPSGEGSKSRSFLTSLDRAIPASGRLWTMDSIS